MSSAKGYLDLLHCDLDPHLLYKSIEDDLSTGHVPDFGLEDQENNLDVLESNLESCESGEMACLCSSTGDAYEKIADLAEYVLKDKLEESMKEILESLGQVDAVTEGCSEPKTRRPCCLDAPEPKRQKIASPQGLSSGNCSPAAFPRDASLPEAASLPNFHLQFSVTTIAPAGRLPKIFGPPDPVVLDTGGLQMFLAFLPPSPGVDFLLVPAVPDESICLAEGAVNKTLEISSPPSEKANKRPELVDTFSALLKTSLRERCRLVATERDILLDHLYVSGDLLRCHIESRSGKHADLRVGNLEEKERMTVESLFRMLEENQLGAYKTALVLGKAGMGKSLLAQKICLDWSNGRFARFEFVFWFDCRRLQLLQGKHYNVRQLLFRFSVNPQEGVDNNVYRYLLQNPDKVLLIFDGFEALQGLEGFSPSSDSPTRKESWGIGAVLGRLFQKKALDGCVTLLTSQPKDKLHQYLPKVDKILELVGFSPHQAEAYLARYFEGCPHGRVALDLIKSSPYLFSYCYNPDLCRMICFDCKLALETGDGQLPSTLTGLLVRFLLRKLGCAANEGTSPKHGIISALAQVAWSLGQGQQRASTSIQFPSFQAKEVALKCGILEPLVTGDDGEEGSYVFSSFVVHNFLVALHLVLAKEVKDRRLTKHLWVASKPKKSPCSWDLVPRFLAGLLFLQEGRSASFLFGDEEEVDTRKMIAKKRNSLCKHIRKLEIGSFDPDNPDKLMRVFRCIHETEAPSLLRHLALRIRPDLSFFRFPFTPPDICILHSILTKASKKFALDLRRSSVGPEGLKRLASLQNVTSFRAPLGDVVELWERLWETTGDERLQSAVKKFTIGPFKAESVKDVDDLVALVSMQEKMMRGGEVGPSGGDIREIPAVADLRHLEFALGPTCGLEGFKKLVEILGAFPALRHLDLDSQKENEIGDEGAAALSQVLPHLRHLETLDLSQNKITNLGAEKLAPALPHLPSLKILSVYNNSIGDTGAETFAKVLSEMTSLRVLNIQCNKITAAGAQRLTDSVRECPHIQSVALWNPSIPHGILEHLQQLDSRIRSL